LIIVSYDQNISLIFLCERWIPYRPVARGGCKGAGAPPFLLKEGCNDEFAPPPLVPYKRNCF